MKKYCRIHFLFTYSVLITLFDQIYGNPQLFEKRNWLTIQQIFRFIFGPYFYRRLALRERENWILLDNFSAFQFPKWIRAKLQMYSITIWIGDLFRFLFTFDLTEIIRNLLSSLLYRLCIMYTQVSYIFHFHPAP